MLLSISCICLMNLWHFANAGTWAEGTSVCAALTYLLRSFGDAIYTPQDAFRVESTRSSFPELGADLSNHLRTTRWWCITVWINKHFVLTIYDNGNETWYLYDSAPTAHNHRQIRAACIKIEGKGLGRYLALNTALQRKPVEVKTNLHIGNLVELIGILKHGRLDRTQKLCVSDVGTVASTPSVFVHRELRASVADCGPPELGGRSRKCSWARKSAWFTAWAKDSKRKTEQDRRSELRVDKSPGDDGRECR